MGKIDDYTAGRAAGLQQALKIVKQGGVEELEKEIQFRNMTGINTVLMKKELDDACEKIKNRTLDTILVISVATLRDEFDFGKKRCERFIERLNQKADCLMSDMASWSDYTQAIRDEMGIEIVIRSND